MAKKAKVWDGTAWQEIVNSTQDMSAYSTTAQMNTAITNAVGLTLIASQTISTSTLNFSNSLSDNYKYYRLVFNMLVSANNDDIYLRFRENTTDKTASYAYSGWYLTTANSSGGIASSSASSINLGGQVNTIPAFGAYDIYRPSASAGNIIGMRAGGGGVIMSSAGYNGSMTNFNGLTLTAPVGSLTGTAKLYAYKENV